MQSTMLLFFTFFILHSFDYKQLFFINNPPQKKKDQQTNIVIGFFNQFCINYPKPYLSKSKDTKWLW